MIELEWLSVCFSKHSAYVYIHTGYRLQSILINAIDVCMKHICETDIYILGAAYVSIWEFKSSADTNIVHNVFIDASTTYTQKLIKTGMSNAE